MNENSTPDVSKRTLGNKMFTILWFGCILIFGVALPLYFTMTNTGTAAWLIDGQVWIFTKLSGTAKWYPVVTGLLACVIHVFAILGIVSGISWLIGLFRKKSE